MADTAARSVMARNEDELAARRTADFICHLLRDYIPKHSFRDAWDCIAEASYKEGWELTDKTMRKEYELWKRTQIDILALSPLGKIV